MRKHHTLLDICRTPALAAEVTLQPVDRHDVDAAILFADILLPLEPLGAGLEFAKGEGPVIPRPVRVPEDVARLHEVDVVSDLGYVGESIRAIVAALDRRVPLIGFAGGPFTVASYLIEGGSAQGFIRTKRFLYEHPAAWEQLMERLARLTRAYLGMQVAAGADAVQLFDSWAGMLSPTDYRRFVLPWSRRILEGFTVPTIHFGTQTGAILTDMRDAGASVVGVDWRIGLDEARAALGSGVAVQGNLDPALLFAPWSVLAREVRDVLARAGDGPGYVFNVGHGIQPETPVQAVADVVRLVRDASAR